MGRKKRDPAGRGTYEDIMHLPHPVSGTHPPMDIINRAAQFAPFAALTGYDAAIRETGRLTERFVELEEYEQSLLNERMQWLQQHLTEAPRVTLTCFVPDGRKAGGSYVQITGIVRRMDAHRRVLILRDGREVEWCYLCEIAVEDRAE